MTKRNICLVFLVLLALLNCMQAFAGPLHEAADRGDVGAVKTAIRKVTDINERDKGGRTALMFAVNSGNKELVKLLLEKGADVNAKDHHGITALMDAAGMYNIDIVRLLIEHGADVNARSGGTTALMAAAGWSRPEIVALLIRSGAAESEIFEATGFSMRDREAAREDAIQKAIEQAFSSMYDVFSGHNDESSMEIIRQATEKLKKNRATILHSYDVVSEHTEDNGVCRVKVRAVVYTYRIKELFGAFGQNLK